MNIIFAIQLLCVATMVGSVAFVVWIDSRTMRIPDAANIAIAGSGSIYQLTIEFDLFAERLATGLAMFCILYSARSVHAALSGRVGLGLGDVKLIGGISIWIGIWNLPLFMLLASLSALMCAAWTLQSNDGAWRSKRIPFGPFLGLALIAIWFLDAIVISTHI